MALGGSRFHSRQWLVTILSVFRLPILVTIILTLWVMLFYLYLIDIPNPHVRCPGPRIRLGGFGACHLSLGFHGSHRYALIPLPQTPNP